MTPPPLEERLNRLADGLIAPPTPEAREAIGHRTGVLRRRRRAQQAAGVGVLVLAAVAGSIAVTRDTAPEARTDFADPHAAISDGIVTGTGVECTSTVRARITLHKGRAVARPIVEVDGTVQVLGFGPSVEEATEDATRAAIDVVAQGAGMDPEEAYMLLSIVGELRIGTSPRPVMAARLIIPRETLAAAGWSASW